MQQTTPKVFFPSLVNLIQVYNVNSIRIIALLYPLLNIEIQVAVVYGVYDCTNVDFVAGKADWRKKECSRLVMPKVE